MTDDTDLCGAETKAETPCKNTATRSDGRCHLHTEIEEERARPEEGCPSKIDDVWGDVMEAAERGLTYEGIARVAGIGLSTLDDWRREHDEFARELEQHRSIGEQKLVDRVAEEKPEFILERSYDYIKTEKHEVDRHTEGEQTLTIRREVVTAEDPDSNADDDE